MSLLKLLIDEFSIIQSGYIGIYCILNSVMKMQCAQIDCGSLTGNVNNYCIWT